VALQGTLDTFALADVLRLLANTRKSGRLELEGDRGAGRVWLGDGQMIGGEAPAGARTDSLEEVVFHLLRFETGDFEFHADDLPDGPMGPFDVEEILIQAEQSLVEWRDIEVVVPSMDGWLTLVAELGDPERTVKLTAEDWQMVAAIGGGTRVVDLAVAMEATDLRVCRSVKVLVERELVAVGENDAVSEAPDAAESDVADPDVAEFDGVEPIGDEALADELAELSEEVLAEDALATEVTEPVALEEEASADTEYLAEDGIPRTARARLDVLTAAYVDEPEQNDADALRNLMPEPLPGAGLTNGQLGDADLDGPYFTGEPTPAETPIAEAPPAPVAEAAEPGPIPEPPVEVAYAGFAEPPVEPQPEEPKVESDPELARQLSTLSPQAAAAIASAAGSINDPGRDPFPGRVRRSRSSSRPR
jgi:hypothetical protein